MRSTGSTATLEEVIIVLPFIVVLLVFGAMSGQASAVVLLPTALVLGAGAVFITIAMRDGRRPPDPKVRALPTDHLRRQMYLALRPPRSKRKQDANEE